MILSSRAGALLLLALLVVGLRAQNAAPRPNGPSNQAAARIHEGSVLHTLHLDPKDARASDRSVPHDFWRTFPEALKWCKDLWDSEETTRLIVHPGVYPTPIDLDNHRSPAALIVEAAPGERPVFDLAGMTNRAFLFAVRTHNLILRGFHFSNVGPDTRALHFRRGRQILIDQCTGLTPRAIRLEQCDRITFRRCGLGDGSPFLGAALSNQNILVEEAPAP
ncbi:MAG: hypothetical protein J0L75_13545 [Spirochaetes bacterium]|nr:hypothetical protein [Spirochaetota bacterium]